ncbi:MAG: zinc-dependent metalloprotease [Candidatus Geothermincolia bacterium]
MSQQPHPPSQDRGEDQPLTFIEAIFKAIDSVARKIAHFAPLGRGLRNAMNAPGEGLISWEHVREIAFATLDMQRVGPEPIQPAMVESYQQMLRDSQKEVAAYTKLKVSGIPERVEVFDQKDWIDANIVSFRFLFDPISERYVRMLEDLETEQGVRAGRGARRFARTILSAQVGIIMGYLSRNVLGQFDLSLPEPEKGGKLYVVEPNVLRIQRELGMDPTDFRMWITLHEVTHSFEFHCNGWLRPYMMSSMQEYLNSIDWKGMAKPDFFRKMRQRNVSEGDALKAGGLISIVATPEQRAILARLQAVMSVLEGYSNHVMDQVGMKLLPSYDEMKSRFDRRRESKSAAEKLFQRLIGINLKMQQYKIGQKFVDAVVEAEGVAFLNKVWESAGRMPTIDEIGDPTAWIARTKAGAAPGRLRLVPNPNNN